jgi:hypothetical protein
MGGMSNLQVQDQINEYVDNLIDVILDELASEELITGAVKDILQYKSKDELKERLMEEAEGKNISGIISILNESNNNFNQSGGKRRRMRKTHKKRTTRRSHKGKKHMRKTRKH